MRPSSTSNSTLLKRRDPMVKKPPVRPSMNIPAVMVFAVNSNTAHFFKAVSIVRLRSKNFTNVAALCSRQHFPVRDHVRDARPLFRRKLARKTGKFHEDRGVRVQKIGGELLEPGNDRFRPFAEIRHGDVKKVPEPRLVVHADFGYPQALEHLDGKNGAPGDK